LESLKFAVLFGREPVVPKIDLDLVERASELEGHLRIVFVDHRRSSVFANVETLVERKADRLGERDAPRGNLLAIDTEGSVSPLPIPPPS
jgi:hypothetical protein